MCTTESETAMKNISTFRTAAALAAVLGGALLTGCGGSDGEAKEGGWPELDAQQVTLNHPETYKLVDKRDLPKGVAAEADVKEGTVQSARIYVQTKFMQAGDVDMAALGASTMYEFGGTPTDQKDIEVKGTDRAKLQSYTFASSGKDNSPARGTRMVGINVVGMDHEADPWVVRITAPQGKISHADLDKIVKSIRVTG
ncbi:hypothetical protein [Streptomyces sp. NPDC059819]|uniref:hypothetical protein n=1 Tax=Streptomyces sp. NPDC059819 TaxID=3346963 RepID=UPI00364DF9F7